MSESDANFEEIIIDEEFQRLLPPLDERAFCSLEDDILIHGCMNPLVLWNGILIDGHNRFNIVTKHNLPFNTISLEFDSRDEVLAWMIKVQIDRRNLTPMQLTYYRGLHYNIEKKLHGDSERFTQNVPRGQNVTLEGSTASRLSEQYRVTSRTIKRDGEIADVIIAIGLESEEAKHSILSGETRISRKHLRELSSATEVGIATTASEIVAGTFEENRQNSSQEIGAPNSSDKTASHPMSSKFITGANKFIEDMQTLPKNTTPDKLKKTIRSYIDSLEKLYGQI